MDFLRELFPRQYQRFDSVADQGNREYEISYTGESGLKRKATTCQNNAHTTNFIAVSSFSLNDLPSAYRSENLMNLIKAQADLTLRVLVLQIDKRRPLMYPGTNEPFPPYNRTDLEDAVLAGSAWVKSVRLCPETNVRPCPCDDCQISGESSFSWGLITVVTTNHVVYNTQEAKQTIFHFHFDAPETDLDHLPAIKGLKVIRSNIKDDWSEIRCVSHDVMFVEKVGKMLTQYQQMYHRMEDFKMAKRARGSRVRQVLDWFLFAFQPEPTLTMITSHPHGGAKVISVGKCCDRKRRLWYSDVVEYVYTNPTCPGSSGGPVTTLGSRSTMVSWCEHSHSRQLRGRGLNSSNAGLADSGRLLVLTKLPQFFLTSILIMWIVFSRWAVFKLTLDWLSWSLFTMNALVASSVFVALHLNTMDQWLVQQARSHPTVLLVFSMLLTVLLVVLSVFMGEKMEVIDVHEAGILLLMAVCVESFTSIIKSESVCYPSEDSAKIRCRLLWTVISLVTTLPVLVVVAFMVGNETSLKIPVGVTAGLMALLVPLAFFCSCLCCRQKLSENPDDMCSNLTEASTLS